MVQFNQIQPRTEEILPLSKTEDMTQTPPGQGGKGTHLGLELLDWLVEVSEVMVSWDLVVER